jgi:hypothetical protein
LRQCVSGTTSASPASFRPAANLRTFLIANSRADTRPVQEFPDLQREKTSYREMKRFASIAVCLKKASQPRKRDSDSPNHVSGRFIPAPGVPERFGEVKLLSANNHHGGHLLSFSTSITSTPAPPSILLLPPPLLRRLTQAAPRSPDHPNRTFSIRRYQRG